MSEPLKGKEKRGRGRCFAFGDVESAVSYLKEQLLKKGYCNSGDDLLWEINDAFYDVVEGAKE